MGTSYLTKITIAIVENDGRSRINYENKKPDPLKITKWNCKEIIKKGPKKIKNEQKVKESKRQQRHENRTEIKINTEIL